VIASAWGPDLAMIDEARRPQGHCLYVHATAMVDSEDEARRVLAPLETCPMLDQAVLHQFAAPTTLADEFRAMAAINPVDHRYATDCMWTDAGADELIPRIRPLFTELPTPTSFSIWYGWDPPRRARTWPSRSKGTSTSPPTRPGRTRETTPAAATG
jgi:hypothetical protein